MHARQKLVDSAKIGRPIGSSRNRRLLLGRVLAGFTTCSVAMHSVQAQDDPYREQRSPEARAKMDAYFKEMRSIEFGRKQIKEPPADSFVDLDFEEVANYQRLQIYERLAKLLQPEVHPQPKSKAPPRSWMKGEISREEVAAAETGKRPALHHLKPGRMTVRVFAASDATQCDLIEYRWAHDGLHLRALVAFEVVRLDLDLSEIGERAHDAGVSPVSYLRELLPKLIRLEGETKTVPSYPYKAEIPLPDDLREGVEFSSNPDQLLNGMDHYFWFKRIDGFVESGKLALLFYLKPGQKMNFQDASKWFSDDFRQLVHEKAREQGKLPPETQKADE